MEANTAISDFCLMRPVEFQLLEITAFPIIPIVFCKYLSHTRLATLHRQAVTFSMLFCNIFLVNRIAVCVCVGSLKHRKKGWETLPEAVYLQNF